MLDVRLFHRAFILWLLNPTFVFIRKGVSVSHSESVSVSHSVSVSRSERVSVSRSERECESQ